MKQETEMIWLGKRGSGDYHQCLQVPEMEGVKKKELVLLSGGTRGNRHKLKCRRFPLNSSTFSL